MSVSGTDKIGLDKGKRNLKKIIGDRKSIETKWNEADTRFQFIDLLLTKCLGWPRDKISLEKHDNGEYTDYELGVPRSVIWEAKRSGAYFELPAGSNSSTVVNIVDLLSTSEVTSKAIRQVQQYCASRGVQYAVVCNGQQIIAFLATRWDGVPPLKGRALVFNGFIKMISNFSELWQMLSAEGVSEKRLSQLLLKGEVEGIPRKLSSKMASYNIPRYKNESQHMLRTLAEMLIEDIPHASVLEEQFYKQCYCESGALSQYALISKTILNSRYASLPSENEGAVIEKLKPNKKTISLDPATISGALARRPFIILGDVGVGKTSFLKNLTLCVAKSEIKKSFYIYIDLGSSAALEEHLEFFIKDEIKEQLWSKYNVDIQNKDFVREVYKDELVRFKSGIYGDLIDSDFNSFKARERELLEEKLNEKGRHLTSSIRYISQVKYKQVVIIIDNADQRNINTQQDAFIISESLASETDAILFIAIRPKTFYKSRQSGSMSAYQQKVFSIAPPRIDLVLERRLLFAIRVAKGELAYEGLESLELFVPTVGSYMDTILRSIKQNRELKEFLDNITAGNVRSVIELVRNFIGSPNVESDKILDLVESGQNYIIPIHEFSKSAILGEFSHFHEESSLAMNVFDVRFPDKREHFVALLMLAYLNYDEGHRDNDGFVQSEGVYLELQEYGYSKEQIEESIRRSTNKKLIETNERITFEEGYKDLFSDPPKSLRLTTVGAYHLLRWAGRFEYLDAMITDTPIFDSRVEREFEDEQDLFNISSRLKRATSFRKYLTACWNEAGVSAPYFSWTSLIDNGDESFERVKKYVSKMKT